MSISTLLRWKSVYRLWLGCFRKEGKVPNPIPSEPCPASTAWHIKQTLNKRSRLVLLCTLYEAPQWNNYFRVNSLVLIYWNLGQGKIWRLRYEECVARCSRRPRPRRPCLPTIRSRYLRPVIRAVWRMRTTTRSSTFLVLCTKRTLVVSWWQRKLKWWSRAQGLTKDKSSGRNPPSSTNLNLSLSQLLGGRSVVDWTRCFSTIWYTKTLITVSFTPFHEYCT